MVCGQKCQKCNLLVCCKFQIQPAPLQQNIAKIAKPAKSGKERLGWIWLDWLVSTVQEDTKTTSAASCAAMSEQVSQSETGVGIE